VNELERTVASVWKVMDGRRRGEVTGRAMLHRRFRDDGGWKLFRSVTSGSGADEGSFLIVARLMLRLSLRDAGVHFGKGYSAINKMEGGTRDISGDYVKELVSTLRERFLYSKSKTQTRPSENPVKFVQGVVQRPLDAPTDTDG